MAQLRRPPASIENPGNSLNQFLLCVELRVLRVSGRYCLAVEAVVVLLMLQMVVLERMVRMKGESSSSANEVRV